VGRPVDAEYGYGQQAGRQRGSDETDHDLAQVAGRLPAHESDRASSDVIRKLHAEPAGYYGLTS
jgi:hypothetical protein